MASSYAKEDLQVKFSELSSIVEEYAKVYRRTEDERLTIATLRKELEDVRESESVLREQFRKLFEVGALNASAEYADLLESYRKAKEEVTELKQALKQMKELHTQELADIRDALEVNYNSDKKLLIDKITELERAAVINRKEFEKKENHLYEQLQLQQTNAAMRFDELEIKYKASLDKAANEHRILTNTCNSLRTEIFNIKSQMRSGADVIDSKKKSDYEEKIKTLQNELNATKEQNIILENKFTHTMKQLKETHEELSKIKMNNKTNEIKAESNKVINVDDYEAPFRSNVEQPLNADDSVKEQNNSPFIDTINDNLENSTYELKRNRPQSTSWSRNVPVYKTHTRGFTGRNRNGAFVPPLRPIETGEILKRKRKLCDPNDNSNIRIE